MWRFVSTEPLASRAFACEALRSHRAWWPAGRRLSGARSPSKSGRLERSQDAPDRGAGSWSDVLSHYPTKKILNQLTVELGGGELGLSELALSESALLELALSEFALSEFAMSKFAP